MRSDTTAASSGLHLFRYVRVSSEEQAEGASLNEQTRVIDEFFRRKQHSCVASFEDIQTAAKDGRAAFNKMIAELKRGRAQGVVFHKVDRSSRNYADWVVLSQLMDEGIYIAFAAEGLESTTPGGRLTMDLMAALAVNYIRNLKAEVRKGISGRVHQGLITWHAPLGYLNAPPGTPRRDRCLKSVDPQRAPLVRRVFELYATGEYTLDRLAQAARDLGLTTRAGRPLVRSHLVKVLDNPFYMGLIRYEGQLYPGKHEPLITSALFNRVQELRGKRQHAIATKHEFAYKQQLQCGWCDRVLTGERQKQQYIYYRCHNRNHDACCVNQEYVHEAVMADLARARFSEEELRVLLRVIAEDLAHGKTAARRDRQRIQLALNEVRAKRERILDGYARGIVPEHMFVETSNKLTREEREQTEALVAVDDGSRLREIEQLLSEFELLYSSYLSLETTKQRQTVRSLYSNLSVTGKIVATEPKKWFAVVLNRPEGLCGGAGGTDSRTFLQELSLSLPEHQPSPLVDN